MNEAETRAEHIDPALKAAGWGVVEGSRIQREYPITLGRIEGLGRRGKPLTADYVLVYRNHKLAVIEAKAWDESLTEGVAQAKNYSDKMEIRFAYSTNGRELYGIDIQTGKEGVLDQYPTPEELWNRTFAVGNAWRDRFAAVPFEDKGGYFQGRYYQDLAIERVMEAIATDQERILLSGANDESNWRGILEYFSPAVQLGLTATPKRKDNVDTYKYFGEPVYIYSLKDGINDGFLTPFKVKQISTTMDEYVFTPDDKLIEGEIEIGKRYEETDSNRIIEITEREAHRVKIFMGQINQNEKTLVFCATQDHALAVRDLVNQMKKSADPNYCQRVTANDGALGEQHLRDFQDNEKTVPTILTTSQKLSTGVDARNIRNIVLMRPINSMIEFKQIIGRGTRLYDGKDYFTIYDFVKAHHHFNDPEWDGEPLEPEPKEEREERAPKVREAEEEEVKPPRTRVKVKLADGKARTIQHMMVTSFWHPDGTPMSAQQFMEMLFGKLPDFFKKEMELRALWSAPDTPVKLLFGLAEKGFGGSSWRRCSGLSTRRTAICLMCWRMWRMRCRR